MQDERRSRRPLRLSSEQT